MRLLCGVLVLVLPLLTGCSGDGDDPARPDDPTPDEPDVALTVDQLDAVLLTPDDLSPGFTGGQVEVTDSGPSPDVVVEAASEACQQVRRAASAERLDPLPRVEAVFTKTDLGPFLQQAVIAADADTVARALDELADAHEVCPSFTLEHPDGTRTAVELHPTQFPEVGDRSVTIEMGMTTSDGTTHLVGGSTTVLAQVGPHLLIVAATHYADQEQFAEGELEDVVKTALANLEDART